MKKNKINYVLKNLRKKIWLSNILNTLIDMFFISSIGFLLIFILAHVYPIVYVFRKAMIFIIIMMLLGFIIGLFRRPSIKKTALVGDELGLKERLLTYLEYKDKKNIIIEIFKEELEDTLKYFDIVKKYKFNFSFKKILISILVFVISIGIYFISSVSMETAIENEEINKELIEEAQNIEKIKKDIEKTLGKDEYISNIDKEKIVLNLKNMEKKLKNTFDYNEGAAQVFDAQKELKEIVNKSMKADLKSIAGVFDGLDNRKLLKDAFESEDVEKALQELKSEEFASFEKEKMLKNIKEMEKSLDEDSSKKDMLKKMKTALKGEATGERVFKAISDTNKNKEMKELIKEAETKLNSMKERLIAKGDEGFKSIGGEDKAVDFANGENEDYENGEMTSQKCDEMALGVSGNKKVESQNGVGGQNNIDFDHKKRTTNEGQVKKNNQSTRLGEDESNNSFVKGNLQDEGRIENKDSDDAISVNGEIQSADYMYRTFQEQGMDYVLKNEIPIEHKQLVLEYFNKLYGGAKDGREDN